MAQNRTLELPRERYTQFISRLRVRIARWEPDNAYANMGQAVCLEECGSLLRFHTPASRAVRSRCISVLCFDNGATMRLMWTELDPELWRSTLQWAFYIVWAALLIGAAGPLAPRLGMGALGLLVPLLATAQLITSPRNANHAVHSNLSEIIADCD